MKAAIIGGGVIGGGWAARFLLNGWDVDVHDPDPDARRKIVEVLGNARRTLPGLYDALLPDEGTLRFKGSIADAVAGADWVQESVPERLEIKHRVLAEVQAHAAPDAVIGSSTSGFRPSQLQEGAADPAQILVAHPFNPVYLLPLVELVAAAEQHPRAIARAREVLTALGMYPLTVRKEIDAHIADRLLEAVWREALWLVKDGIATTEEIDEAIRMGFGLRWGQMGLFETYRIAGGEAGMRHFLAQFGPALKWPWTKLTDVPEFTPDLVDLIAGQSDAQSGRMSIRELERLRDDNLVAMMRALKRSGSGAGRVITAHEATLPAPGGAVRAQHVPVTWTDHNGHMNETHALELASKATDTVLAEAGADAAYIAGGHGFFTAENTIRYLAEVHAGDRLRVVSRVTDAAARKLRLRHTLILGDGTVAAEVDSLQIHVSLHTRRACAMPAEMLDGLQAVSRAG